MNEWNEPSDWNAEAVSSTALLDVLFEDAMAYETIPASQVEWQRSRHPVVLWRFSSAQNL